MWYWNVFVENTELFQLFNQLVCMNMYCCNFLWIFYFRSWELTLFSRKWRNIMYCTPCCQFHVYHEYMISHYHGIIFKFIKLSTIDCGFFIWNLFISPFGNKTNRPCWSNTYQIFNCICDFCKCSMFGPKHSDLMVAL